MASFREKINAHLPIVLQLLSTTSLIVIALSAVSSSKYLKKFAERNNLKRTPYIHRSHMHKEHIHRGPTYKNYGSEKSYPQRR